MGVNKTDIQLNSSQTFLKLIVVDLRTAIQSNLYMICSDFLNQFSQCAKT